jgi:hypothetical protein
MNKRSTRIKVTNVKRSRMIGDASQVAVDHQATTTAEHASAMGGDLMSNYDKMEARLRDWRQRKGERNRTLLIEKESTWKLPDPTLRAPGLFRRLHYGTPKPARPPYLAIDRCRHGAMLIGENYDVVVAHDN